MPEIVFCSSEHRKMDVYLCKKPLHPWILRRKYIFPGPLSGRFMKEKDNGIDALGEIVDMVMSTCSFDRKGRYGYHSQLINI